MKEKIRVIIADDHPLLRKGIQLVLAATPDIKVVGEARDGIEAIEKVTQLLPHLILLDVKMPNMSALEVVKQLQQSAPDLKIVMISAYDEPKIVEGLIQAGVLGYMLKEDASTSLISMIRKVMAGERWFSEGLVLPLPTPAPSLGQQVNMLTDRERDVLLAIAQGATNGEIAERFNLAAQTVRNYTSRIYEKLEIASRAEAIVWAYENGFESRLAFIPPLPPTAGESNPAL